MSNSCHSCGQCCKLFYINITRKESESGQYQLMDQDSRLYILAKKSDGSCIYQDNNRCGIHSVRPKVCRQFFCTSKNKKYKNMIKVINTNL